jgi:hypothetical protein
VEIRAATPTDFARIGELSVAAYRADGQLGPGTDYARTLADVARRAAHGEVLCAVDAESGEVLGAVTYVLPGPATARRLYARLGFVRDPDLDWQPVPAVTLLGLRLDLIGAHRSVPVPPPLPA